MSAPPPEFFLYIALAAPAIAVAMGLPYLLDWLRERQEGER